MNSDSIVQRFGSLAECSFYIILSNELKYGETDHLDILCDAIRKMLTEYIKGIRNKMNHDVT